jgi:hypothetical protein
MDVETDQESILLLSYGNLVRYGTVLALRGIVSLEHISNYTEEEFVEGFIKFQSHLQNLWGAPLRADYVCPTYRDPMLDLFPAIHSHQVPMTTGNLVGQAVLVEPCIINFVRISTFFRRFNFWTVI